MDNVKIHFLNTIWSDAIILEKDNHFAFIDTATDFYYPMIQKHLKDFNIETIDFIVLTHFHGDHYGNVASLINDYNVKTLYLKRYYGIEGSTGSGAESDDSFINNELKNFNNILKSAEKNNTKVVFINEQEQDIYSINFQNIDIELYSIRNVLYDIYTDKESKYYKQRVFNENHNSIGVFFKVNDFNVFLGADLICMDNDVKELDNKAISIINQIYKRHNINHIDLYKSCHHGHYENNPLKLCELIKPNYTVITNTSRWLDTYSTYDSLKKANPNVNILLTDHQKYVFTITDKIQYYKIDDESLFIILNKD